MNKQSASMGTNELAVLPQPIRDRESRLCRRMAFAKSNRDLRSAQHAYATSPAVKLAAAYRALRATKKVMPDFEDVQRLASAVNLSMPCGEMVKHIDIPKGDNKYRRITVLGPQRRAMDIVVARMLKARLDPHPGQYEVKGRGRDRACDAIAMAITNNQRRYAVTADIENAFGSIDREQAFARLPVRADYLFNTLTTPLAHTTISSFGSDEDAGLPQGAAASNYAMAILLQPVLEYLPSHAEPFSFVDDFCILDKTETAAAASSQALKQAFASLPGNIGPKQLEIHDVREGFDFLGYRFRLTQDDKLEIDVSELSIERFLAKCLLRAEGGATLEEMTRYSDAWHKGFKCANVEDTWTYLSDKPLDALLQVSQQNGLELT